MHDIQFKPLSKLSIDPQPRKDLEIPPMVQLQQPEGVSVVRTVEPKRQELGNLFVTLDFSRS
jgi:hypothetical protein